MKKIVAISCVKNECDIIETFCRYTLTYSDMLLIHENRKSSDNTREIIQKLIDEGLPVYFEAEGEDVYFEIAKSKLAGIAIEKYNADLIVQIDADEFLFHSDGTNPRDALEKLSEQVEYQIPWRTYIYEKEPPPGEGFAFGNFTHYRNPAFEKAQGHAGKTIASRYLLREKQAKYEYGGHWLTYPESPQQPEGTEPPQSQQQPEGTELPQPPPQSQQQPEGTELPQPPPQSPQQPEGTELPQPQPQPPQEIEVTKDLLLAHYPIRSRAQAMNKAIINYINKWQLPEQQRVQHHVLAAYQLGLLFSEIKENGEISEKAMRDISIKYSLLSHMADKAKIDELLSGSSGTLTVEGVPDTSFCEDKLITRYTSISDNSKEFLRAQLCMLDDVLQYLDNESRAKTLELFEYSHQIKAFAQERELLKQRIEDMYQSKTWKIGSKIVRVYRFFVRGKDD